MTHGNERWQEYAKNGEVLKTDGRDPSLGNPELDEENYVSSSLIWLYRQTENGLEVLFQKRSPFVDRHPNLWDIAAGGHIDLGETPLEAAVREAREEIGANISAEKLRLAIAFRSPKKGLFLNEYLYDWTGEEDTFHFDDQEVSEVKWIPLADFDSFLDEYAKPPLKDDLIVRLAIKERLAAIVENGDN